MISKVQYENAKSIVDRYERQLAKCSMTIEEAKIEFPIGCFIISKNDSGIRGTVESYSIWAGVVQLLYKTREQPGKSVKQARILVTNAIKL